MKILVLSFILHFIVSILNLESVNAYPRAEATANKAISKTDLKSDLNLNQKENTASQAVVKTPSLFISLKENVKKLVQDYTEKNQITKKSY